MANVCITDLKNAAKDLLTQDQVDKLKARIEEEATSRQRLNMQSRADALNQTVEDLIKEKEAEKNRIRKQSLISIIKANEIWNNANRFKKTPWRGMLAETDAIQSNLFDTRGGAGKLQEGTVAKLFNGFYNDLRENNVYELYNNLGPRTEEAVDELFDEGTSKDKDIKNITRAIKTTLQRSRKLLMKSGAVNIGDILNYVIKQMHNPLRLRSSTGTWLGDKKLQTQLLKQFGTNTENISEELRRMAFERWRNTIKPELNMEKVFGTRDEEEIEKMLQQDYSSMASGEHQIYSDDTGMIKSFKSFGLSKKLQAHRKYIFKTGKGWYKYQQAYGYGTFQEQFEKQIWDAAHQIGFMEKFGPNGMSVFENVKERLIAKYKDIPNIRRKFNKADWTMLELQGKTRGNPDNLLGKAMLAAQALKGMNLGSAVLSSLGDIGMSGTKIQSLGESYFEGEMNAIGSLVRSGEDKQQIASLMGILSEGTIGSAISRFSSSDSPFSTFARLNSLTYKFNLLHGWDYSHITGYSLFIGKRLAQFADKSFEEITAGTKRTLTIHGIGDKEWDLLRAKGNRIKSFKNEYIMAPDLIKNFTKESIAKYLDKPIGSVTASEIDDVKELLETKFYNYIADESHDVIANPSISTKAMINQGTRGDEIKGRILRWIGQFQYYNIESTRRTLGRYIYGGGAENLHEAFIDGKADIRGMTEFMLQQMKWGYMSLAAFNLATGLEAPDPRNPRTILDSFERGGSGWAYFSLLSGLWNKYNRDMGDMLKPRALGTIEDMSLFGKALLTQNHPLFYGAKLAQKDFSPFGWFYSRLAINHALLYGLMEKSKPGYLRRMEKMAEKDGEKYWLAPTEHTNLF